MINDLTTQITPNGVLCLAFNSKTSYQEKVTKSTGC